MSRESVAVTGRRVASQEEGLRDVRRGGVTLDPEARSRQEAQVKSSREPRGSNAKASKKASAAAPDEHRIERTILPIPDRPRTGLITYDAKDPDTEVPPIREVRPPKGAPNLLVILLDDVGFGASSAF